MPGHSSLETAVCLDHRVDLSQESLIADVDPLETVEQISVCLLKTVLEPGAVLVEIRVPLVRHDGLLIGQVKPAGQPVATVSTCPVLSSAPTPRPAPALAATAVAVAVASTWPIRITLSPSAPAVPPLHLALQQIGTSAHQSVLLLTGQGITKGHQVFPDCLHQVRVRSDDMVGLGEDLLTGRTRIGQQGREPGLRGPHPIGQLLRALLEPLLGPDRPGRRIGKPLMPRSVSAGLSRRRDKTTCIEGRRPTAQNHQNQEDKMSPLHGQPSSGVESSS